MRNFIKGMLINRFGIILATLNVCYFVSMKYVHFVFEHTHSVENCFKHGFSLMGLTINSASYMLNLNSPAEILSFFPGVFMQLTFPGFCFFTHEKFQIVFFLFFVTLQWLFIGCLAKTVAEKIQSMKS